METKRNPYVGFRLPPQLLARLDQEAAVGDRTRSAQIVRFIKEGFERIDAQAASRRARR